jgi:hypothetical protein
MAEIELRGFDEAQRLLNPDLDQAQKAAALAIAQEAQDRIAPYPSAPPRNGNTWYERGYGTRRQNKDGSISGIKTSENLGRSWGIVERGNAVILANKASYSGLVQSQDQQAGVHERTGWKTDEGVVEEMEQDGTIADISEAAISHALGVSQ